MNNNKESEDFFPLIAPDWPSLLDECAYSFFSIVQFQIIDHCISGENISVIPVHFQLSIKAGLADLSDFSGDGGDAGGDSVHLLVQSIAINDDPREQSVAKSRIGVDRIAGEEHLGGDFARDGPSDGHS